MDWREWRRKKKKETGDMETREMKATTEQRFSEMKMTKVAGTGLVGDEENGKGKEEENGKGKEEEMMILVGVAPSVYLGMISIGKERRSSLLLT